MNEETELKLRVPEGAVTSLRRSPVLTALRQRRGSRRHLLSVYFDTPSLALAKKGMTLRVRHVGNRKVQGVKLANGSGGGSLMQRPEVETEIEGDRPDIALIPDENVRRLINEAAGSEALAPAFISEFGRTTWPVKLGDSDIEVALDVGEIRAGDNGAVPISEVELELKAGRPDKLIELALALGRTVPISVERRSKAERGFALVTGLPASPARAAPVELDPEMSQREAFLMLARSCMAHLGGNEAAVRAGNPEGIHQMRVAARRLRALLACFRDLLAIRVAEEFKTELRWLMKALGSARDLDVLIGDTLGPLIERLTDETVLKELSAVARKAADRARLEAQAAIATPRYAQFLLTVDLRLGNGDWISGNADVDVPVSSVAHANLRRRGRRLLKIGSDHQALEIEQLHQIRIAAKKMRYACEFFRSLYSRKMVRRYLKRLGALQDRLGSLNDAVAGRRLLDNLIPELRVESEEAGRLSGLVLGWQSARIHADLAAFEGEWDSFRELRPFWAHR
jgi:inorganic triphosphatase YgiF